MNQKLKLKPGTIVYGHFNGYGDERGRKTNISEIFVLIKKKERNKQRGKYEWEGYILQYSGSWLGFKGVPTKYTYPIDILFSYFSPNSQDMYSTTVIEHFERWKDYDLED